MMSDETETELETRLEAFAPDKFSTDSMAVEGQPALGNRVEVEYSSSAGGAFASSGTTTVSGELLYVEVGKTYNTDADEWDGTYEWDGTLQFVIRDDANGRGVTFTLKRDPVGKGTLRTLAASSTKRGRRLGRMVRVTFTDERVRSLAPVAKAIREVQTGDTLMVNGSEYGVVDVWGSGPERRPDGFKATLTRPNGDRYHLTARASREGPLFSGPDCGYGEYLELDVDSVQPGRFTTREGLPSERREGEDTTDMFPAPHGVTEGERVTVTLNDDGEVSEVSGEVTDVRYFKRTEDRGILVGYEEMDPETEVELDDGRTLRLQNENRARADVQGYRTMLIQYTDGDGENEYSHPVATEVQREGGEGGEGEDERFSPEPERPEVREPEDADAVREFLTEHGADTYLIAYTEDGEVREVSGVVTDVHRVLIYVRTEDGGELGIPLQTVRFIRVPEDGASSISADGGVFQNRRLIADGGRDVPEVAVSTTSPKAECYHDPLSPCRFHLKDPEVIRVTRAHGMGLRRCPSCKPDTVEPPESGEGEPVTDGGADPEALASAVSDALASSDLSIQLVSVYVTELERDVTVQGNGPMARADWTGLRDRITEVLDANGFTYRAKDEWGFVEVTGREVQPDGGVGLCGEISCLYRRVERALNAAGLSHAVDITPDREGVTVEFSGVRMDAVMDALADAGLTGGGAASACGPSPEDETGAVRVTGGADGGDGDE
jgi:hypothetical protein